MTVYISHCISYACYQRCMHEQSMTYILRKKREGLDVMQSHPLHSCAGVTRRGGLLSHAQNVLVESLIHTVSRNSSKVASLRAAVPRIL